MAQGEVELTVRILMKLCRLSFATETVIIITGEDMLGAPMLCVQ